jgi:Ankyrin repeat
VTTLPPDLIGEFMATEVAVHGGKAAEEDQPRALGLLQKHPDLIHARWMHDETLIHFMAVEGFYKSVKFLAEHGADVNAVNEFGRSAPYRRGGARPRPDCGGPPSARRKPERNLENRGDNALHCAVQRGYERLIRLLLEAGADPRYRTDLGESVFDALPASGPERESIIAILADTE